MLAPRRVKGMNERKKGKESLTSSFQVGPTELCLVYGWQSPNFHLFKPDLCCMCLSVIGHIRQEAKKHNTGLSGLFLFIFVNLDLFFLLLWVMNKHKTFEKKPHYACRLSLSTNFEFSSFCQCLSGCQLVLFFREQFLKTKRSLHQHHHVQLQLSREK